MIEFGQATDVGIVRDHNEDNILVLPDRGIWLVADGMGGYEAGEIASAIVVEEVPKLLGQGLKLNEILSEVHQRIHKAVKFGRGVAGMGSTAVLLHVEGNSYEIAWVGDSRAYLWDGSSLMQLTRDHSYVQQLLDSGAISEAEALNHPQGNVISQALGSDINDVKVDSISGKLAKGDRILLCSDGLTSEVTAREIAAVLARQQSCQTTADLLINKANENGGSDNISVILVGAPEDAPRRVERGATRPMSAINFNQTAPSGKKRSLALIYGMGGFLLAAIPLVIWIFLGQKEAPVTPSGGGGGIVRPSPAPVQKKLNQVSESIPRELLPEMNGPGTSEEIRAQAETQEHAISTDGVLNSIQPAVETVPEKQSSTSVDDVPEEKKSVTLLQSEHESPVARENKEESGQPPVEAMNQGDGFKDIQAQEEKIKTHRQVPDLAEPERNMLVERKNVPGLLKDLPDSEKPEINPPLHPTQKILREIQPVNGSGEVAPSSGEQPR